ncbi:MAG: DegV family protein, partial [Clostridia bacterium]
VVDSQTYTCLYGQPVIHAAHMVEKGATADEIEAYLKEATADFSASFVVGDLEHLKKGGRINAATLLFANMLDIKPMLTVRDGLVVQCEKVRGEKRVNKKIIEMAVKEAGDLNGKTIITVDADVPDKIEVLTAELKAQFPDIKILNCKLGPIIGTHGGPTLYGFAYSTSGKFDLSDYEEE